MALIAVGAGICLFFHFRSGDRAYNTRMQRIEAGEVKPELLSTVTKRKSSDSDGSQYFVTLRGSNQPSFEIQIPRECFDLIQTGDRSVAYRFPDGYFIPQFQLGGDSTLAQCLFLGAGLVLGALLLADPFFEYRKSKTQKAH
jgi:hypothetical protein